ncbi:MAG: LysR family transcriptional regulator [Hyphomicrobiales bacterium]|nr:LysR family transcriptional regulator [Hyphomicrobiales bacterium]
MDSDAQIGRTVTNKTSSSEEIAILVRVVETGSFAAAADELALTPSGVSKAVTRLEDRLGVKRMQRTTQRPVLTGEGETLRTQGRSILAAIEAAGAQVTIARGKPRGLLKVNTGTAFAKHRLAPRLPAFQARYPEISLELSIADRCVDVQPVSALMPPDRQHLPRVRACADFLAAEAGRHDLPLS